MSDVFISYSRKNSDFVRRLHQGLAQLQRDAWVDFEDIPLTADWWQEICAGIESAQTFVFVITPDSLASPVCHLEVAHAVSHNKRVLPIVHRESDEKEAFSALAAIIPDDNLKNTLAGREIAALARENWNTIARHNWLFFRENDDFNPAFEQLIAAIDTDLDHLRLHTRLLVRAREWESKARDNSFLLTGEAINEAENWLTEAISKEPLPTALHTAYLNESRIAEQARQAHELQLQRRAANRLRYLVVGLGLFLIVAIGLTILAVSSQRVAENNEATAAAALATVTFEQCPNVLLYNTDETGNREVFLHRDPLGLLELNSVNVSRSGDANAVNLAGSPSGDQNWAAFASDRDGNWEIYAGAIDGSEQQRITSGASIELDPQWSPNNQYIAFESNVTGNWDILIFEVSSGDLFQLTDNPANDRNANWWPDSKRLIFESDRDGFWQIYEIDLSAGFANPTLTRISDGQGDDVDPVISLDGQFIAFRSLRADETGQSGAIYLMDSDGRNARRISPADGDARNQSISPDSRLVAYERETTNDAFQVFVYEPASGSSRQITTGSAHNESPTWRCDSQTLVLASDADGDYELYEIPALPLSAASVTLPAGGRNLTNNRFDDRDPIGPASAQNSGDGAGG
jgi:Tol biopolymer transport system component